MNKVTLTATTTVALLVASLSTGAFADMKDQAAVEEAQKNVAITLPQAVTLAEAATGGKQSSAEFDLEDGMPIYEVVIDLPDGTTVDVDIDAESGVVLAKDVAEKDGEMMKK